MLKCLFCDKTRREVKHLIAAEKEGVCICDECVGVAMLKMGEAGWAPPWMTIKQTIKVDSECADCGFIGAHIGSDGGLHLVGCPRLGGE